MNKSKSKKKMNAVPPGYQVNNGGYKNSIENHIEYSKPQMAISSCRNLNSINNSDNGCGDNEYQDNFEESFERNNEQISIDDVTNCSEVESPSPRQQESIEVRDEAPVAEAPTQPQKAFKQVSKKLTEINETAEQEVDKVSNEN